MRTRPHSLYPRRRPKRPPPPLPYPRRVQPGSRPRCPQLPSMRACGHDGRSAAVPPWCQAGERVSPSTSTLDTGILVLPTMAGHPLKRNSKQRLSSEFEDKMLLFPWEITMIILYLFHL
ncbi:hypothetical protein ZWY2020_032877 [Hordeum vulgare]|nr:hypothetical protein ZWY2020_032877 [Hordeum vulgare]